MDRLVKVHTTSIYFKDYNANGRFDPATEKLSTLPDKMSWAHPSFAKKLQAASVACLKSGVTLTISDLFRTEDMQRMANLDYQMGKCWQKSGEVWTCINETEALRIQSEASEHGLTIAEHGKKAFSPPIRSSFHEIGCAVDVNMNWDGKTGLSYTQEQRILIRNIMKEAGLTPIAELSHLEEWHYEDRTPFASAYTGETPYKNFITAAFAATEMPPYADGQFAMLDIDNPDADPV